MNVVAFSPNGRYLATTGLDNQVMIWDLSSKETIHRCKTENVISGLAWNPKANTLAMVDDQ